MCKKPYVDYINSRANPTAKVMRINQGHNKKRRTINRLKGIKMISMATQVRMTLTLMRKPIIRDTTFQVNVRRYFSNEPPL
jgi:hypothetical protein